MHRRFTDAVLLGGGTDGGPVFYQVKRQLFGALIQVLFDIHHSPIEYFTATLYEEAAENRTATGRWGKPLRGVFVRGLRI